MRNSLIAASIAVMAPAAQAIEEPRYQVLQADGAFELRQYEPVVLAQVEVSGDASAGRNAGFRLLAGYIFGGNQGQQKIAMTAPVTQSAAPVGEKIAMTAPVTQTAVGDARWRVTFMMPSAYTLDTLPRPNDARIEFVQAPGERRAVIRFDGFSTDSNLGRHRALLEAWVQQRGLKPAGDYVVAFYNDPFTLPWNRRNEWWVAVE